MKNEAIEYSIVWLSRKILNCFVIFDELGSQSQWIFVVNFLCKIFAGQMQHSHSLAKLDISRASQSRFQAPLSLSLSSLWLLRSGSKHYIIYASCLLGIISGLKKYSVWLWAPNFKQLLSQQIENILLKKFLNLLMQLYTNTSDTLNMELLPFTGKLNWFRLYWKMFRLVTTNNTKTGCWSGH